MFDKFKANHGGSGPLQALNLAITGGEGLLGRAGVKKERNLTDALIDSITEEDANEADLSSWLDAGRNRMTSAQHQDFRAALQQHVSDVKKING